MTTISQNSQIVISGQFGTVAMFFFLGGGVGGGSWGGSWHGAEDRPKGPNKADQTGTSGRKIIDIQIQICRIKHIWFSLLFFIVHQ